MTPPTLSAVSRHVDDLEVTLTKSTTTLQEASPQALANLRARLHRLQRLIEDAAIARFQQEVSK